MFGDFVSWSWISSTVIFAIGGVAGYIIARQIKDKRTRQLEQDLEVARNELGIYRKDVNRHFLKTSLLFNKLTDDYREIYEHLATGAQSLCSERPGATDLKLPENDILPGLAAHAEQDTQESIPVQHIETSEIETTNQREIAKKPAKVSGEEKSLLIDDEDVHLGEESAPAIDINSDDNRSIH